ncbi:hypothetical protein [Croceimicrobium hydrocarbonivorans]|uniref:Uncharacterized protein n=1 Tax=Croceimicrobium hydrocarbonivorans TaxID=2761580 RepID=A0A7H0VHB3_9FLAO|nr:hypothetical protein [Croceimicrobium hydrocarbonivorans]QNR25111.1 hypothetical protein H4K34_04540 [Croceimicrobium hydrocarbonivorans]
MKQNIIITLLILFPILLSGQNNEVSVLVENEVDTVLTFKREFKRSGKLKRSRTLIEVKVLNSYGLPVLNQVYRKNKISWEKRIEYYDDNSVRRTIDIKGSDTTVTNWGRKEFKYIITGGLPDYIPKVEYYPNGLMKTETSIGNNGEFRLEYEYIMK